MKIFEEYNQYYTEITPGEDNAETIRWIRNGEAPKLNFNSKEIETIFDLFNNPTQLNKNQVGERMEGIFSLIGRSSNRFPEIIFIKKRNYQNISQINIIKFPDDYFHVYGVFPTIYKCDQLDGLIKCLKDNDKNFNLNNETY